MFEGSASSPDMTTSTGHPVDALVMGTVNAPYKRSLSPDVLADCIATGDVKPWVVHVATFFTDVRPGLVFEFADLHHIAVPTLISTYMALSSQTGERSFALEAEFDSMAAAA